MVEHDETRTIDGVQVTFHMAPGSEAPAEMLIFLPQFGVLDTAEDVSHTMHNLYTLRGSEVRDGNLWSRYIGEALDMFGDKTDVVIGQHTWPVAGRERVAHLLATQRDPLQVHQRPVAAPHQSRPDACGDRRNLAHAGQPRARMVGAWLLRHAQPQFQGGLPEVSRLVRRQPVQPQSAAAGRERAQDGGIHGRRRRGDRPRPRGFQEGRIPLGGERHEPGRVRRSRQPRRAKSSAQMRWSRWATRPSRGRA